MVSVAEPTGWEETMRCEDLLYLNLQMYDRMLRELNGTRRPDDLGEDGLPLPKDLQFETSPASFLRDKHKAIARLARLRRLRGETLWTVLRDVECGVPIRVFDLARAHRISRAGAERHLRAMGLHWKW
jgi:hypothetical protein